MAVVVPPSEGLERLRAAAGSGELRALCQRRHVSLLTVFGSAGRGEPDPRDLDIGVLTEHGADFDLYPAVIQERLREMQLLLADLVEVGEVDAERLRRERPTRHVIERVLSQIVELAGSINTHIVASLLGRSPDSYADSFDEVARAGVLEWDLATALRPSAGMHNVLVHDCDHATDSS